MLRVDNQLSGWVHVHLLPTHNSNSDAVLFTVIFKNDKEPLSENMINYLRVGWKKSREIWERYLTTEFCPVQMINWTKNSPSVSMPANFVTEIIYSSSFLGHLSSQCYSLYTRRIGWRKTRDLCHFQRRDRISMNLACCSVRLTKFGVTRSLNANHITNPL